MQSQASSYSLWVVENSLHRFEDRGFDYHWRRPEDYDPFGGVSFADQSLLASEQWHEISETMEDVFRDMNKVIIDSEHWKGSCQ